MPLGQYAGAKYVWGDGRDEKQNVAGARWKRIFYVILIIWIFFLISQVEEE